MGVKRTFMKVNGRTKCLLSCDLQFTDTHDGFRTLEAQLQESRQKHAHTAPVVGIKGPVVRP